MSKRHRFKQAAPLRDRLTAWAEDVRKQADQIAPGLERDEIIKKARQADTAAHMDEWLNSPGLQPPTQWAR